MLLLTGVEDGAVSRTQTSMLQQLAMLYIMEEEECVLPQHSLVVLQKDIHGSP